uniref:Uncharacterized protein n=1 Tax=Craspedostauros australis TaxID=1486917 RepID=A0A7R9WV80_9STRA|mmetsp:Transcript_22457/g.62665  ORF Transcript_22457/g.62665 Transcript_22457/m.62665 type:complete len:329 (+) Transcript_22457:658-1644(+)|eukprot:CAMPEP_0198122090 /NCGR_PEP_ID=MMETSP1442-20131203/33875_1 /TAXON_ID= /ORGANISM="Craspedostauros australis, Strain CCMP3328" /LENGTH=328 /DNA_ID=CAMNT_0043781033 /DNA_START=660 /DNA_END=1646 /DNA_ORIENTATION=-
MSTKRIVHKNNLGSMWIKEGRYETAIEYLNEAVKMCEEQAQFLLHQAPSTMHHRQKRPEQQWPRQHQRSHHYNAPCHQYHMVTHAPDDFFSRQQPGGESLFYCHPITIPMHMFSFDHESCFQDPNATMPAPSQPHSYLPSMSTSTSSSSQVKQQQCFEALRIIMFNNALAHHLRARTIARQQDEWPQFDDQKQVQIQKLLANAELHYHILLSSFEDSVSSKHASMRSKQSSSPNMLLHLAVENNLANLYIMTGREGLACHCFQRILRWTCSTSIVVTPTSTPLPSMPAQLSQLHDFNPILTMTPYTTLFHQNAICWIEQEMAVIAAAA